MNARSRTNDIHDATKKNVGDIKSSISQTRGRRILILKSGIGFRILARPTDRIRIPDFRIRIPDICHINIQWTPLYSTPHAVDSRLNPIYFFATYFLPLIKDAAYYRHSLLKHIFSP